MESMVTRLALSVGPARFALLFALGFGAQFAAFETTRGSAFENVVIHDLTLLPTAGLVNHLLPHEALTVEGHTLVSPGSRLNVTRGCEGVEMAMLWVAAIFAFPATAAQRARGLAWGLMLSYGLTVARLIALHLTLRYSPRAWDLLHGLVLPLGPIICMAFFFLHWSGRCGHYSDITPLHAA